MKPKELKGNLGYISKRFRIISVLQILVVVVGVFVTVYLLSERRQVGIRAAPQEAVYYFETTSKTVTPGEEFWAQLFIDTCRGSAGCAGVSSAAVMLRYNPSQLQVIDAQGNPTTQVTLGDYATNQRIFPSWAENTVDVTNGVIKVSGFAADLTTGQPGTPFSGTGIYISIRFRTLVSTGSTQVTFDYIPFSDSENKNKDGSNIFWAGAAWDDILNLGNSPNPVAFTASIAQAGGASLSLVRADSVALTVGNRFNVNVVVNSGGQPTVATDAVIRYPMNLLRVVDANTSVSGVQVTHGTIYSNYEYANGTGVDTTNGVIDLSGYTLSGTQALSNATFATIRFEVLAAGTANVTFDYVEGRKDESNVLLYQSGVDIAQATDLLRSVNNLSLTLAGPQASPTPTSKPTPTPTPTAVPTPTPTPTPTPIATPVAPKAAFNANPNSGQAPLTVTFTNQSTGNITSYAWDFNGDGIIDRTLANPGTYTYQSGGTYYAKLTVTGPGGSSSAMWTITVTGGVTPTPSPTPTTCFRKGDISTPRDCCVNGSDVSVMVARWGWIVNEADSYVDLDGNSKINGADVSILVANWGGTCR